MKIDSGTTLTRPERLQPSQVDVKNPIDQQDRLQLAKENTVQAIDDVDKVKKERLLHENIAEAVKDIETYTKLKDVGLQLKIDRDLDNGIIVALIDKENDEIIRQIPSEEAVELAKHLKKVFDDIDKNRKDIAGSFVNDIV